MRKDTSFSDRKLSVEEFSQKYWMNGEHPYQYHTAGIEDGRDEREQFIFNNIRALYGLIRAFRNRANCDVGDAEAEIELLAARIRRWGTIMTICNAAIAAISLLALIANLIIP